MKLGKLFSVGVPLGSAEYLPLKAIEIIKNADILLASSDNGDTSYAIKELKKVIPEINEDKVIFINIPKVGDYNMFLNANSDNSRVFVDLMNTGNNLVYISRWDSCLSYEYDYIHNLIGNKFETEIIPTISIESIIANKLNETISTVGDDMHIFSSSEALKDLDSCLKMNGTRVFVNMSEKKYAELIEKSKKYCYSDVKIIDALGLASEKIYKKLEDAPRTITKLNFIIIKGTN